MIVQGEMEITGVGPEFFTARDIWLVEGRVINMRDHDGMNRVIMIDTVARDKFFKNKEGIIGEIVDCKWESI